MEKQKFQFKDQQEILNHLNKLEDKLQLFINFYEELGTLRQKRKTLLEDFKQKGTVQLQERTVTLKKQVTFDESDLSEGRRLTRTVGLHLEKKKSLAQIFDLLENLSSYHDNVNRKISELQILKHQDKSVSELYKDLELDKVLDKLQGEKDDIDDKIIQFVIKNVIEGKDELFNIISNLEDENKDLAETVNLMEGRIDYLKNTIMGLMTENNLLKKGERRLSESVRKSVLEKSVSFLLPDSLRVNRLSELDDYDNDNENLFDPEEGDRFSDVLSVQRSTTDSFTLDAALASWATDEATMQEHVHRIGRHLETMEVNQMKLDLLKRYVQRHGAKYINRNTLIDPTKGMSLWNTK